MIEGIKVVNLEVSTVVQEEDVGECNIVLMLRDREYYEENAATQSLHALEDEETMKASPRCLVNQLMVVGGLGRQYDQIPGGQLQESVWQC